MANRFDTRAVLLAMTFAIAATASAEESNSLGPWSLGLDYGTVRVTRPEGGDGSSYANTLELGWAATERFGTFLDYMHLNNPSDFPACPGPLICLTHVATVSTVTGWGLGIEGNLPLGDSRFRLLARIGLQQLDYSPDTVYWTAPDPSESVTTYGVGADAAIRDAWSLRLDYRWWEALDHEYAELSVGLRYRF